MNKQEREKKRQMIRNEIMTSGEVCEYMNFSRARLYQIVKDGRITPIVETVYLKDEIVAFKKDRSTFN